MLKYIFLIISLLPSISFSQQKITWDDLKSVKYAKVERVGPMWWYGEATFASQIQQLSGKEVTIQGYILPLDETGGYYVLSRNPYSTCFFCGAAGQESVMELKLEKPEHFDMDQVVTFRGTLTLDNRAMSLSYRLLHAKPVK